MARGTVSNEVPHPSTIRYTNGMSDLKLVDLNKYKRNPSHIEGKERLDSLFKDFVRRGADPEMVAEMIVAYGICENS